MAFKLSFDQTNKIIQSVVRSPFNWVLLEKMVPALAQSLNETGYKKLLLDFRKSKIAMSTMMIYKTPKKLFDTFQTFGIDIRFVKRALVVASGINDFQFLENVSENQGQYVKIFEDYDEAIDWLIHD